MYCVLSSSLSVYCNKYIDTIFKFILQYQASKGYKLWNTLKSFLKLYLSNINAISLNNMWVLMCSTKALGKYAYFPMLKIQYHNT